MCGEGAQQGHLLLTGTFILSGAKLQNVPLEEGKSLEKTGKARDWPSQSREHLRVGGGKVWANNNKIDCHSNISIEGSRARDGIYQKSYDQKQKHDY